MPFVGISRYDAALSSAVTMPHASLSTAETPCNRTPGPTKTQKKPREKSCTASTSTDAWGCNLFAARQSKAAEEAMLLMPLPKCVHQPMELFAVLSAVVLWLRVRSIQVMFFYEP